jgi:hypothetical protein
VWAEVFTPSEGSKAPKLPEPSSLDEAVKQLEALPRLYDQMTKLTELPRAEFDAQYPKWQAQVAAADPVAAAFVPALDKMMAAHRRAAVRLAMFRAAIAIVRGGPEKVKDFRDPAGDGPFEYHATDGGFELKSKLLLKDQPLTLRVGKK